MAVDKNSRAKKQKGEEPPTKKVKNPSAEGNLADDERQSSSESSDQVCRKCI